MELDNTPREEVSVAQLVAMFLTLYGNVISTECSINPRPPVFLILSENNTVQFIPFPHIILYYILYYII